MTADNTAPAERPRVLVVGGSGYVASLVLPLLQERFALRVFDRAAPANPDWEFRQGDVTDFQALRVAAEGRDLLLYMAMGKWGDDGIQNITAAHNVNVQGLHLALEAAVQAGIERAVYTSSLSVHDGHDLTTGEFDSETVHPEPRSVYGLTKWMGEEACRFAHRIHGLPILALRLFLPVSPQQWHAKHDPVKPVDPRTSAPDLARALEAALLLEHRSFDVIHITGDTSGRAYRHLKAKRLLGWEPLEGKDEG
jgi:nucleoside-diphosphate-sugar epimerase